MDSHLRKPPSLVLSSRKKPRQARAKMTVDAIFEATIQLLLANGMQGLTTTRVAERAGVSVGTMYQYFPNKQALIYALNESYLERLAQKIEQTCLEQRSRSCDEMVEALVDTYWAAKAERADVTRALYRSVAEMDNSALIEDFSRRVDAATVAMLSSASEPRVPDLEAANLTLVAVIFGAVRNLFEHNLTAEEIRAALRELKAMCQAYLRAASAAQGPVRADPAPEAHPGTPGAPVEAPRISSRDPG